MLYNGTMFRWVARERRHKFDLYCLSDVDRTNPLSADTIEKYIQNKNTVKSGCPLEYDIAL